MNGPPAFVEWHVVGCGVDGCTAEARFTSQNPNAVSVLPPLTVSCPVHGQVGVHTEPPGPGQRNESVAVPEMGAQMVVPWQLRAVHRAVRRAIGGTT